MTIEFTGEIFYWKGPAPFYFVAVPDKQAALLKEVAQLVTYGWGMIPVNVRVGGTMFATSLFPKDGRYLVPVKDVVRQKEHLQEGDVISILLEVRDSQAT